VLVREALGHACFLTPDARGARIATLGDITWLALVALIRIIATAVYAVFDVLVVRNARKVGHAGRYAPIGIVGIRNGARFAGSTLQRVVRVAGIAVLDCGGAVRAIGLGCAETGSARPASGAGAAGEIATVIGDSADSAVLLLGTAVIIIDARQTNARSLVEHITDIAASADLRVGRSSVDAMVQIEFRVGPGHSGDALAVREVVAGVAHSTGCGRGTRLAGNATLNLAPATHAVSRSVAKAERVVPAWHTGDTPRGTAGRNLTGSAVVVGFVQPGLCAPDTAVSIVIRVVPGVARLARLHRGGDRVACRVVTSQGVLHIEGVLEATLDHVGASVAGPAATRPILQEIEMGAAGLALGARGVAFTTPGDVNCALLRENCRKQRYQGEQEESHPEHLGRGVARILFLPGKSGPRSPSGSDYGIFGS